jgi:glutamine synthetase
VDFRVYRLADPDHCVPGQPADPPAVIPLTGGYQLLSEDAGDHWEPVLALFRRHLATLGITLRTAEVEFGPSQLEVALPTLVGMAAADTMVLLRSALRQVGRHHGYHVALMCRPQLLATCSSGWHLHQSLRGPDGNAFVPDDPAPLLSKTGRQFAAGQLAHGRNASPASVARRGWRYRLVRDRHMIAVRARLCPGQSAVASTMAALDYPARGVGTASLT